MGSSNKYHNANRGDFGLLKSICNFLCSMIEVLDDDDEDGNDDGNDRDPNPQSETKQDNEDTDNIDDNPGNEDEILSPILSIVLALSIISSDFASIIYVVHRILTRKACQVLSECKDLTE